MNQLELNQPKTNFGLLLLVGLPDFIFMYGSLLSLLTLYLCLQFRPEEKIKELEKKANSLIEESCFATNRGDFPTVSCSCVCIINSRSIFEQFFY